MIFKSVIPKDRMLGWLGGRITSEGKLLLDCSRTRIDDETQKNIRSLLKQTLDWPCVLQAAKRNNVTPLLYNALIKTFPQQVPADIIESLAKQVKTITAHSENNQSVLLELLKLFEQAKIPVIPFKGVTFTLFAYGSLSLRAFGDIDLLVHSKDFLRAQDLLIRNDYQHVYFGHAEVSTVQAQLVRDDKRAGVDLHYGLTPHYQHTNMPEALAGSRLKPEDWNQQVTNRTCWFFYLDPKPLWERLDSIEVSNTTLPIFSKEDLLLVASINGIKENWRMLKRVSDIVELVCTHPDIDWALVLVRIKQLRCEQKFFLGLRLAHDSFNLPLPDELTSRIKDSAKLGALAIQIRQRFGLDHNAADTEIFRLLSAWFTMDSMGDKISYFRYIMRMLKMLNAPANTQSSYYQFMRLLIRYFALLVACKLGLAN